MDPVIQKVAALLRKRVVKLECTYELALAIMFLDRLGERKDEETIQTLALQLIAGQSYTGGWTYRCPRLTADQQNDLLKSLRELQVTLLTDKQLRGDAGHPPEAPRGDTGKALGKVAKFAVFQKPELLFDRKEVPTKDHSILFVGKTDNSNTQFAMLALWAAGRHNVPVRPTFRLAAQRFWCSQAEDGSWDYEYCFGGRTARPYYRTNTAVGLLAFALDSVTSHADNERDKRRQKQIVHGLAALSHTIDDPTEQLTHQSRTPNYYLLWSIERVATLYNLKTFGEKDWYRWGTELLIATQHPRGYWPPPYADMMNGSYGSNPNTSFALLFLTRTNLTKDLSAKLPFKPAELNKGIITLRARAGPDSSSATRGNKRKDSSPPP